MRQSRLLGPNGKPLSFGGLYQAPRHTSNPRGYRPRAWLGKDTKQNVGSYDRMELVDYSRQLMSQIDVLGTAVWQKNNWAFGSSWDAHYHGTNKKWSEPAKEFLQYQFYPFCNVRGPLYDLRTSMRLMGQAWDRDGDDAMVLTESESGFPQIAFFPATRIGNWGDQAKRITGQRGEVMEGDFKGATIFDGIILDRNNRCIGIRVLNDDGTFRDISSYNADLAYEPAWSDQVRGIPRIAASLLRWMNLQEIDEFIQAGVKRASGYSMVIKTVDADASTMNTALTEMESAAASDSSATITDGSASERKVYLEEIAGGGGAFLHLDSTQGESIEPIKYDNPHPNVEAAIKRIQRGSLASVGWPYELLCLDDTGRAATRLLADLANMTISDRQETGLRRWRRIIGYALAKGAKNKFIPNPPDPRDFALWMPGFPKQISVDAGNDVKSAIELCKFGISVDSVEVAKLGYHIDFIEEQQEQSLMRKIAMAKRVQAEIGEGVTFMDCMQMVRQNNPNPVSQPQQQSQQHANE